MKLTIRTILVAAALLIAVQQSNADITLSLDFQNLHAANTSSLASSNGTLVLLASTLNLSFGNLTLATTSFTDPSETDDIVLNKWKLGGASAQDGVFQNVLTFTLSGNLNQNDPLLLVWYPNLTFSPGLTGPGNNQIFGLYRSDSAAQFSDIGFLVPADGSLFNLVANTVDAGGDIADSSMVANLQTVPEPSSIALAVLGCLGALALRRRKQ